MPRWRACSFHEGPSVDLLCRVLVVRAAQQPDPVDIVPVRARKSVHVIEFPRSSLAENPEPCARRTTIFSVRRTWGRHNGDSEGARKT